jgi:uncharacterized Zn finger protein
MSMEVGVMLVDQQVTCTGCGNERLEFFGGPQILTPGAGVQLVVVSVRCGQCGKKWRAASIRKDSQGLVRVVVHPCPE